MAIQTVPIHRSQWTDLVLRMDIPTQRKAVAFALAKFANADGTRVFPGQKKVADMAKLHETNARAHIRALVAVGMLIVVKRGGGRNGDPHVYRLTRPADITMLPLWLDPEMNRYEDDDEEHEPSALGEEDDDGPEYQAPPLGETQEQGASALGESVDNSSGTPVDNPETPSADALHSNAANTETPSVSERNTERFEHFHRALALPDQSSTNPRPTQPPAGLPKVTPSLALVPPIHNDDEMTTKPEPPTPPADPEYDTARAALAAMRRPVADAWRHAARAELETAGIPLSKRSVEIRAADLAAAAAADHTTNGVA